MAQNVRGKNRVHVVYLFLIIAILVGLNFYWVTTQYKSSERVLWHQEEIVETLFITYHQLMSGQFNELIISHYPSIVNITSTLFGLFLFGVSDSSIILSMNIFFVILLMSVYGIGKLLYDEKVGLIATLITGLIPIINILSRSYNLDLPLAAMTCLSIYLLLKAERFTKLRYSLLFGLSLGVGLLTKWTFFFFLLGPSVCCLYEGFLRGNRTKVALNSGLSGAIAALVAAGWYVLNRDIYVVARLDMQQICHSPNLYPWFDYLFLLQIQMWVPVALLGIAALSYCIIRGKGKLLFFWFAVPYVVFSTIPCKSARYTLPYLPVFAIAIAYCAIHLFKRKRWARLGFAAIIIGFMAVMFLNYAFGIQLINGVNYSNLCYLRTNPRGYDYCADEFSYVVLDKNDTAIRAASEELVRYILADSSNKSSNAGPVQVGVTSCYHLNDHVYYNHNSEVEGQGGNFTQLVLPSIGNKSLTQERLRQMTLSKDYIIAPSHKDCTPDLVAPDINQSLQAGFEIIKAYPLPGNNYLYLLRRIR